jgi:hypothetical protein
MRQNLVVGLSDCDNVCATLPLLKGLLAVKLRSVEERWKDTSTDAARSERSDCVPVTLRGSVRKSSGIVQNPVGGFCLTCACDITILIKCQFPVLPNQTLKAVVFVLAEMQ